MDMNDVIRENINAYELLDVDRNISFAEMKKVARNKIKEVHPDKREKNLSEEENIKLDNLTKMYNLILTVILKNEDTKKQYDEWYDRNFNNTYKKTNAQSNNNAQSNSGNERQSNNAENNNKDNQETHKYGYTIELEQYQKFACDRIDNMPFDDNIKNFYKNKINNCTTLREAMDILTEARNKRNSMSKDLVEQNNKLNTLQDKSISVPKQSSILSQQNNKKTYVSPEIEIKKTDDPLQLAPGNERKQYDAPKLKVIEKKPSWLSRNWKKLLIGAGIATAAVVAAPYLVTPLMYLNSVAWWHFPALQAPLHAINSMLGAIGSISPFASLSYAGGALGQWTINGAFFSNTILNAGASSGLLLTGLSGLALDAAAGFGLTKLTKKVYKELKGLIDDYKLAKSEKREYEEELEKLGINDKEFENAKNNKSAKEKYHEIQKKRKEKKETKQKNRKYCFINKFRERFNSSKKNNKEKEEFSNYKKEVIKVIEDLGLSKETTDILVDKITKAKTKEEIINILDNDINVHKAKQDNDQFLKYKNRTIKNIQKLDLDDSTIENAINQVENAKTINDINNIIENNKNIFTAMKEDYIKRNIVGLEIDQNILNEITRKINSAKTLKEFLKFITEANKIIEEELAKINDKGNNKKRAV